MSERFLKNTSVFLNFILIIMFFVFTALSKISYEVFKSFEKSTLNIFNYISTYTVISIPLFTIFSIAVSISYRKDEEYKKSCIIQFLPAAVYFLAYIFNLLSQI